MRQRTGRLNRVWLGLIGLLLLLAAIAGGVVAAGRLQSIGAGIGVELPAVDGSDPVLGGLDPVAQLQAPLWAAICVAAALILAGLGLGWAIAQVPRKNEATTYRFEAGPEHGVTRCDPAVICAAVERDARAIDGVSAVSAVLRGSRSAPELTMKVTAADRADLAAVLGSLQSEVAGNLATALDAPLARLGVQLDLDRTPRSASRVVL